MSKSRYSLFLSGINSLTLFSLLEEAFELYRSGYLVPRPSQLLFDISKLPDAVSAASSLENHGRVILECSADSTIPVRILPQLIWNTSDLSNFVSVEQLIRHCHLIHLEHFS